MRVLVADDDPVFRALAQELFEQWHFEPEMANDGQQAWDMLQAADPPRLLLLDWMMPGLDGFELSRLIKNDPNRQDTYIIMMTGGSNKDEIAKVMVAGADDYLIKPFDPLDLKIRVRTATRVLAMQDELEQLRQPARQPTGSPGQWQR